MIKLIESKLFGHSLFLIDRPLMQKRYNACLEDIGIVPTKLSSFHIDGWGWSPEIADEKEDRFYLSHGIANPFGIIISPEQKKCPIYMPYHTFDWGIHRAIFSNYSQQIKDITSGNSVWFELDQNISAYRNAQDILMMEVVNVRFNVTGNIQEAATFQKKLIAEYSDNPRSWMDVELRQKIIASSKLYGDLRYRNLQMPDYPAANISSFYTLAFGGLFVFKHVSGGKPVLIFENNSSELSNDEKRLHVEFNLSDHSFIPFLYNVNLLDSEPEIFIENLWLLELQLEHMVVSAAMELDPETPVHQMSKPKWKGLINKLNKAGKLHEQYFNLEALVNALKSGSSEKLKFSEELNLNLLQPHANATKEQRAVLWQLIAKLQNNNPVLLYTFDKDAFYNLYQTWSEPMQQWAINEILKNTHVFSRLTE